MADPTLSFTSPLLLGAGFLFAIATVVMTLIRHADAPKFTRALGVAALALFALAAGGLTWHRPSAREVAVMVDLSPSTRTASYRDRLTLRRRIDRLLAGTPYRLIYFSERQSTDPGGDPLPDVTGERTVFSPPPDAPAILLFSDARFVLTASAPPTYVVADPTLDNPADAAVNRLEIRGGELVASVTRSAVSAPRRLELRGTEPPDSTDLPAGAIAVARPLAPDAPAAAAEISPGDSWLENDALSIQLPPPRTAQRWWVGAGPPPDGSWRVIPPAALPSDPAAYLAPAVIAVANLPADAIAPDRRQRLEQYVRDLKGSVLILGGDHAFAAGAYSGSTLDALSPLASDPPQPTTHWLLVADSSGSMAEDADAQPGGPSRWDLAASAIVRALPRLPPDDLVSVGDFSAGLRWWTAGKLVREAARQPLPPPDVRPRGPTNLEPALLRLAEQSDAALPKELLLLTDADTQIDAPAALAARLGAKKIRLHLLAIGQGRGLGQLRSVVAGTGGTILAESDPARWAAGIQKLTRAAMPDRLRRATADLRFLPPLDSLGHRRVDRWNRTWLKDGAELLADAADPPLADRVPMAARWQAGTGRVLAAAFTPAPGEITAMANLIAEPPRDPRFQVNWSTATDLRITIDAADNGKYLNDQPLTVELRPADDSSAESHTVPQAAPGRYELSLPPPRRPTFATVRADERIIDRRALAGRYPPEFDAIGNDYDAMRRLAETTGGRIIHPDETEPIRFPWPRRDIGLTPYLSITGAGLLAVALVWWKKH